MWFWNLELLILYILYCWFFIDFLKIKFLFLRFEIWLFFYGCYLGIFLFMKFGLWGRLYFWIISYFREVRNLLEVIIVLCDCYFFVVFWVFSIRFMKCYYSMARYFIFYEIILGLIINLFNDFFLIRLKVKKKKRL